MDPVTRLKMQETLEAVLGSKNVYFQPPPTLALKYPCIVYALADIRANYADNRPYMLIDTYEVTLIHDDPDTDIVKKLLDIPWSSFERYFPYENLHHYRYRIMCIA